MGLVDAGMWDPGKWGRGTRGRQDVGRWDVGLRGVGTQELWDIRMLGRDKQTTPEFCAEFAMYNFR